MLFGGNEELPAGLVGFLVARWLEDQGLFEASPALRDVLVQHLQAKGSFPVSPDWARTGRERPLTLDEARAALPFVSRDHLSRVLRAAGPGAVMTRGPIASAQGLFRPAPGMRDLARNLSRGLVPKPYPASSSALSPVTVPRIVAALPVQGKCPRAAAGSLYAKGMYKELRTVWSHVDSVFCALFDLTGQML